MISSLLLLTLKFQFTNIRYGGMICCLLLLGNSAIAQSKVNVQSVSKKDFSSLSWLEGTWTRINIRKPGRTSFEQWKKINDHEFRGLGVTMQGTDTVFVEKLKIILEGNEIHYVADIPENFKPVHFTFTFISSNQFICENPTHDYPKKISYQLNKNVLTAQTSGDGKMQEFVFEKVKQ
jgi:uncharacterized protein DUF6265